MSEIFRPMRRIRQQMTEEDCLRVLAGNRRAALAVHGEEGYPYAVPINFIYLPEERQVCFHCALEGHKLDALRSDPKVCLTLWTDGEMQEDGFYDVESVVVFGRAECVADEARREAIARRLGEKYFPDPEMTERDIAQALHRAEIVAVTIDHMTGKRVHEK